MAAPASETAANASAIEQRRAPPDAYAPLAHEGEMSAAYEPARAMLRFRPNASPSWRALEPVAQRRGDGDDHRLGAETEEEPSERHDGKRAGHAGQVDLVGSGAQQRADEADRGESQRGVARAEPIDEHAADQDHHDVRGAVDGVERSDLCRAEAELGSQDVCERRDRVVDVVVAEHRQAGEQQDQPADRWGWRGKRYDQGFESSGRSDATAADVAAVVVTNEERYLTARASQKSLLVCGAADACTLM